MMRRGRKPKWQRKIAKERMSILYNLAKDEIKKGNLKRAQRYIELMRKIGMRYNVRIPRRIKRTFCKDCNTLLIPSKTSKVRLDSKRKLKIVKCLVCQKIYRYPYKPRKARK